MLMVIYYPLFFGGVGLEEQINSIYWICFAVKKNYELMMIFLSYEIVIPAVKIYLQQRLTDDVY